MFSNLFNLGYNRTLGQAVIFYIVYFIFFLLVSMGVSLVTGPETTDQTQNFLSAIQTTRILGVVFCLGLGFAILIKKGLQSDSMSIILVIVAGVIAYFSVPLFGLIPVAFLTTKK